MRKLRRLILILVLGVSVLVFRSFVGVTEASAHCDTLDGPVVKAGQRAIDSGNAAYALIWVKAENEDEIRKALKRALKKRKNAKNKSEKEVVDREFFETLVRVHREGEGAKFEGLKPAGMVPKEIAMADEALIKGSLDEIKSHLKNKEDEKLIAQKFDDVSRLRRFDINDLEAGREYVHSYAGFLHTVENLLKKKTLDHPHNHGHGH